MDEPQQEPPLPETTEPSAETASQLSLWPAEESAPTLESPTVELPAPQDPPWALADLGIFVVYVVLSFFVASTLAGIVFAILRWQASRGMTTPPLAEPADFLTPVVVFMQVIWELLWLAFIHVPQWSRGWQEIGAIFIVGVVLSYCRGKTGSLLPPFLMHLAYNACLFVSLYIGTSGFQNLRGR